MKQYVVDAFTDKLFSGNPAAVCVVEPGTGTFDCVSRSFAPKLSIPEDPVCGSGHCHIAPYWAKRLGKAGISAFQASRRTGELFCTVQGDRVTLGGKAVLFSTDDLHLQPTA